MGLPSAAIRPNAAANSLGVDRPFQAARLTLAPASSRTAVIAFWPGVGLEIPLRDDNPQLVLRQRLNLRRVPLAGHKEGGSEEIGIFDVNRNRGHRAAGLAGCVEAHRIDAILGRQQIDEVDRHVEIVRRVRIVIDDRGDVSRGQNEGFAFGLILGARPPRPLLPALAQAWYL
jgi:hypothetical protein